MSESPTNGSLALEITDLEVRYGAVAAVRGVSLSARPGQHVTLVGPSGCGKTTTLRAIAGLETPARGRIALFGRTVFDAALRIDVPSERREVSMVFQSYAIWPHMTVFDNVAYGLRPRRLPKAEVADRVRWALELVGMAGFAAREAPRLSGGQQQRVALARSFVFNPKMLLFDEPLSNLDAKLRAQMRIELKELTARVGITSVYVTHDQEEALSLSDLVAVFDQGTVQQVADPLTTYFRPANAFVGDFMGASNLLHTRAVRPGTGSERVVAELENGERIVCHGAPAVRSPALVAIKSVHVRIDTAPPAAAENEWRCRVAARVFVGDFVEYFLDWGGVRLRARDLSTRLIEEGEDVYVTVRPERAVDPYLDTLYSAFEMIESGITTVQHMHSRVPAPLDRIVAGANEVIRAYRDVGMRVSYSYLIREQNRIAYEADDLFVRRLPPALGAELKAVLDSQAIPLEGNFALFEALHRQHQASERVRIQLAPANLHWCTDRGLGMVREYADRYGVPIHMHLVESRYQREYALRRTGTTALDHLRRLGLLGPDLTLGHGVWLTEGDIELAAATGTRVCTNASSNLRIRSGIAPLN